MVWHIARRDLYDNLNSLRFALTTVLLIALMLTNAAVHLHEHPKRTQAYHDNVARATKELNARGSSLYRLASEGPRHLYKKPSLLQFCADGSENFLPKLAEGHNWVDGEMPIWRLTYPQENPNLLNIRPDFTQIDWAFIVGYVLSFIAILFTFDAIAGERERGTLRLMLANAIPRHTVLMGKFFGVFLSILIPFALAVVMNLLVISTSSAVQLGAEEWGRLALLCGIAVLYTSLFIALGLLISARVRESGVSLVILLFTWVCFVVFMPSTLAALRGATNAPVDYNEFWRRRLHIPKENKKAYVERYQLRPPEKNARPGTRAYRELQLWGEYVQTDAVRFERFNDDYLSQQLAQGRRARAMTRLSPAAIVSQLFEAFAGTGFERHQQFLENVRRYARHYRQFVADMDRADPGSLHILGISEGMSERSVPPEAIPKFADTLSLSRDFNAAAMDFLLLLLFLVVLLSGAYLVFVRAEV